MTTKVPVELSSTPGIADSSDATAITISSSEVVTFSKPTTSDGHTSSAATIFEANANGDTVPVQLKVKANNGTTSTQGLYGNAGSASTDNTIVLGNSGTSGVAVGSGGEVGIGTQTPTRPLHIYANSSGDTAVLRIQENGSHVAGIELFSGHGNWAIHNSETVGDALEFRDESENATRMMIDSTGDVRIGATSALITSTEVISVNNNMRGNTLALYTQGGAGTFSIDMWNSVGGSCKQVQFRSGGSGAVVGSITSTGDNATQYNTSSDYRLKENVNYTWDATTKLKQLKPAEFNWISDESNTALQGFLAHEVSSVVPQAITGEKDATETIIDLDGKEKVVNVYQGIDHSVLVPLLVKTIQELEARIATLEG